MKNMESDLQNFEVDCKNQEKYEDSDDERQGEVAVKVECDEGDDAVRSGSRLTSIIDQLRCQSQLKGNTPRDSFNLSTDNGEGGGGAGARRYARDAGASPAHAPPTATPAPLAHHTNVKIEHQSSLKNEANVKSERLSPHDSNASRSRSVTPSTSSYPGTPPERGSPHQQPTAHPPRNYSDIMRSLAARYNSHPNNDYFHRMNGFATEPRAVTSPAQSDGSEAPLGGLFTKLAKQQGGPPRLPAFPVMLDMSSTKALLAISRAGRGGRSRRKRTGLTGATTEHSPLDLSAAGESAAKRARLSASPSTRSDSGERDIVSNDDHSECMCAEARARLSAWTVDDVCDFVGSIDICAEYVTNFREQRIDGAGLPLLTEDHLTGMLQMKLGPALKLRAVLSRRLEACASCQTSSISTAPAVIQNISPKMNGTVKPEPRSSSTSPS